MSAWTLIFIIILCWIFFSGGKDDNKSKSSGMPKSSNDITRPKPDITPPGSAKPPLGQPGQLGQHGPVGPMGPAERRNPFNNK